MRSVIRTSVKWVSALYTGTRLKKMNTVRRTLGRTSTRPTSLCAAMKNCSRRHLSQGRNTWRHNRAYKHTMLPFVSWCKKNFFLNFTPEVYIGLCDVVLTSPVNESKRKHFDRQRQHDDDDNDASWSIARSYTTTSITAHTKTVMVKVVT